MASFTCIQTTVTCWLCRCCKHHHDEWKFAWFVSLSKSLHQYYITVELITAIIKLNIVEGIPEERSLQNFVRINKISLWEYRVRRCKILVSPDHTCIDASKYDFSLDCRAIYMYTCTCIYKRGEAHSCLPIKDTQVHLQLSRCLSHSLVQQGQPISLPWTWVHSNLTSKIHGLPGHYSSQSEASSSLYTPF